MITVERDYCDEEMYDTPKCNEHEGCLRPPEMEWCQQRCKWVCRRCEGTEGDQ